MNDKKRQKIMGTRIANRRKNLNMTQHQLAASVGISDHQLSNIETGKSYPRMSCFIRICSVLDTNADYLLSGIIKKEVSENIVDMIGFLSIEEQKTLWILMQEYIHRHDNDKI